MRVVVSQFEGIDATPVLPLAAGVLVATARADRELAGLDLDIALVRQPIAAAVAAYRGADVLGFSLYPWNAAYALAVAAAARAARPDALIVAGGPSVPRRPAQAAAFLAAHPALDVLVFAEGELAFRDLLRAQRRGDGFDHIAGLAVRRGDGVHLTAPPARVLDLAATGSPYLDGTFDGLWARWRDRIAMALLETNRGCPFSCTFCDWSLTKKIVEYPRARVEAELAWVVEHGLSHVMLADANFGIRPRDLELAHLIADAKRRTGRPSSFYFYLTKNDHARNLATLEILHGAGIATWVGLAVQDFDDDVLAAVERDNIQTGEALALRAICGARGIPTYHELILGLPGQTATTFLATLATATPPLPRHDFVLFLCRLIDNAELGSPESRARHGLVTRRCRWRAADGSDPVVEEFQELVVGTRDLPEPAWRRAFRAGFLTAALYNLRLARVVMHAVVDGLGLPRVELLTALVDALDGAAPGAVYGELAAILDRHADAILAAGPLVLPGPGGAPLGVDDALAHAALARYDDFLAETAAIVRSARVWPASADALLAEAVRYQAFVTPRPGAADPRGESFAHDWPSYTAAGVEGRGPEARPVVATFAPPTYATVDDPVAFVSTHLAVVRSRLAVGEVSVAAPRGARPAALMVLPAGG